MTLYTVTLRSSTSTVLNHEFRAVSPEDALRCATEAHCSPRPRDLDGRVKATRATVVAGGQPVHYERTVLVDTGTPEAPRHDATWGEWVRVRTARPFRTW